MSHVNLIYIYQQRPIQSVSIITSKVAGSVLWLGVLEITLYDKNVDIACSAYDVCLESLSSGSLRFTRLENQIY
jgi:hypothetical protein